MTVKAKPGFEATLRIADAINPVLVVLSIVGLFLEYTTVKPYVLVINQIISLVFVADFLLRLVSMPAGPYFFKAFGWVDFLASLPGIFLILGSTPLLSLFKVVRIGRVFRILRILRFLRVFSFLKQMKADSPWIQERIMQIGVSIVLVSVVGIMSIDNLARTSLEQPVVDRINQAWALSGNDLSVMAQAIPEILYVTKDGLVQDKQGRQTTSADWQSAYFDESVYTIELAFSPTTLSIDGVQLPALGILVASPSTAQAHNAFMLVLLGTLTTLLLVIIFYVGFLFAKDMRVVQLVIDSIDADDYWLLTEEANRLRDEDGNLVIVPDDSEMTNLLKMAGRLAAFRTEQDNTKLLLSASEQEAASLDTGKLDIEVLDQLIESRLDGFKKDMEQRSRAIAIEAVKLSAPALVRYLKSKGLA